MTRPRIHRDELHLSDLARLESVRSHGLLAVLWRDPARPDTRYSLHMVANSEDAVRRYFDSETLGECVVVPVAEVLREAAQQ